MAAKLSKAQQEIVDAMQAGKVLTLYYRHNGSTLVELETADGKSFRRASEKTLNTLLIKGVVKPNGKRGKVYLYILTPEYQPAPTPEPAPLADQPSFPHDAAYAMDTREGVKIFGANLESRFHMYAYRWNVSYEIARAAVRYILSEE